MKGRVCIHPAAVADVPSILEFVGEDFMVDGSGFWPNRTLITEAAAHGDLRIAMLGSEIVGFQTGAFKADMLQVQRVRRGKGIGVAFVADTVGRAMAAGHDMLYVDALPDAEGFWLRRGYSPIRTDLPGRISLGRKLHRWRMAIDDRLAQQVSVCLFSESDFHEGLYPVDVDDIPALALGDGVIELGRRAVVRKNAVPPGKKAWLTVIVGDDVVFSGDPASGEGAALGIYLNAQRDCYVVDRVRLLGRHMPGGDACVRLSRRSPESVS